MRGAGILAYGGAVQLLELPAPEISNPHQLLIRVYAAGVGNWEDIVRSGGWDVGGVPPMALGVEAAGVVRAVGAAVSRFRVGDQVLTHAVLLQHQGAWAEMLVVPEGQAAHKPAAMSFPVAGPFPVPPPTPPPGLSGAAGPPRGGAVLLPRAGGAPRGG